MLEQLKKDYPTMSEEVLKVVADEEGIDTSPATTEQEEVEATTEPAEQEETTEETTEEEENTSKEDVEEETETEPAEQEKKVSLKALHEERNKRKALSAQLEAMKSEIEAIKNRPTQPTQQQQTQQPDISEWVEQQADIKAREKLKMSPNVDIDALEWEDKPAYRKYVKEIAKQELRLENEINNRNQIQVEVNQNLQHFNAQPDFKEVDIYAEQTLNELPLKDARPIQQAVDSLNRGTITKEQISTLKGFYEKCQTEYRETIKSPKVAKPADKIAEMAKHPRASQLSGSNGSRSLSTAEIESMLDQGRFEDVPPEVIKKYMR